MVHRVRHCLLHTYIQDKVSIGFYELSHPRQHWKINGLLHIKDMSQGECEFLLAITCD